MKLKTFWAFLGFASITQKDNHRLKMKSKISSRNFVLWLSLIVGLSCIVLFVVLKYYEPKSEMKTTIQVMKRSNLDPVRGINVTIEVKVVKVNNGNLILNRGFIDTDTADRCEKLTKRSPGSIGLLLLYTVEDCSLERQLRNADRGKYSIVLLVSLSKELPKVQALKNNKFYFVSTVGFISVDDAHSLINYSLPTSDRYFVSHKYVKTIGRLEDQIPLFLYEGERNVVLIQLFLYIFISLAVLQQIVTKYFSRKTIRDVPIQSAKIVGQKSAQRSKIQRPIFRDEDYYSDRYIPENPTPIKQNKKRKSRKYISENPTADTENTGETVTIQFKEYSFRKLLGKGAFGQVWQVTLKSIKNHSNRDLCVVKKIDFDSELSLEPKLPPASILNLLDESTDERKAYKELFLRQYQEHKLMEERTAIRQSYDREVKILEHVKLNVSCAKFVIQIIDSDATDSCGLILMENGGRDLNAYMSQIRTTLGQLWVIWIQMVQAVKSIHQIGVVHLDIKLSNFVWVGNYLKLIDFGNAHFFDIDKEMELELKEEEMVGGTPGFMSPEVLLNYTSQIGPPADIWGLGSILYYILKGEPLLADIDFHGEETTDERFDKIQTALEHIHSEHFTFAKSYGTELDSKIKRLLRHCLEFDPSSRFYAYQLYTSSEDIWSDLTNSRS